MPCSQSGRKPKPILLASGQASSCEYFALQIGLSYADSPKYRLDVCVEDIENMSGFFRQRLMWFVMTRSLQLMQRTNWEEAAVAFCPE